MSIDWSQVNQDAQRALAEDIGPSDVTASLIPATQNASATIMTREPAVLCGSPWAEAVFKALDPQTKIIWQAEEGEHPEPNQVFCKLAGNARVLVSGERAALNFLQTLSATATSTQPYVKALSGTHCKLLDTRKTIPGLRYAQKYATRCGGAQNHRMGLYDAFLIKENHIMACGSITQAINTAKKIEPHLSVEIEVENLAELKEALSAKPHLILLDNFPLDELKAAVLLAKGQVKLEASGNVTLENIRTIAETGVDFISVGKITKDIKAIDMSMRFG